MSSNIEVQRICEHCNKEFTARTTVTRYCSDKCNRTAYKARKRAEKIKQSNTETTRQKQEPIEILKAKEFLTVREVAQLLNCSVRSAYYYIDNGTIKATNLGQRMTRVKRSEIDELFSRSNNEVKGKAPEPVQYEINGCYSLTEIQSKYNVSEKAFIFFTTFTYKHKRQWQRQR